MRSRAIFAFKVFFWIYVSLLIVLSVTPSAGIQEIDLFGKEWRVDFFLHALAFFALPIVGFLASQNGSWKKRWLFFLLLSTLLAVATELVQLMVPGRKFNPYDMLSNFTGFILGIAFILLTVRCRKKG